MSCPMSENSNRSHFSEEIVFDVLDITIDVNEKIPHSPKCKKEQVSEEQSRLQDETLCVECLIELHRLKIDKLRTVLEKDKHIQYNPEIQDDLFLLRYILSNQSVKKAAHAIEKGTKWREANQDLIQLARDRTKERPLKEKLDHLVANEYHKFLNKDGGPVYIIRSGISNPKKLVEVLTHAELMNYFMFDKERGHAICDIVTRKTGTLTKMIAVNDFQGMSLLRGRDSKFMKILGESSELAETLYPQFVEKNAMVNAGTLVHVLFTMAKFVMPKRTLEKVGVCGATNTREDDISKCPFVKEHFDVDKVPSFLGGNCHCEPGCVPSVSNERTEHFE